MKRYLKLTKTFTLCGGILLTVIDGQGAPSITLTSPASVQSLKASDEFFTDTLNDPCDINQRRDLRWEENFDENSIIAAGGTWKGTFKNSTGAPGNYVFPQFQGFSGAINSGKTGANFPIPSSKYTGVSYKMKTSSAADYSVINWTRKIAWPDGTYKKEDRDTVFYTNTLEKRVPLNNTWRIKYFDFKSDTNWTAESVTGLRLDPSNTGGDGTTVEYDWIRVYDPNSAPEIKIDWVSAGLEGVNMHPLGVGYPSIKGRVELFASTTDSTADGYFILFTANTGTLVIPSAMLPPGKYKFFVKLYSNYESDTLLATSGLSPEITISAKPAASIQSPSRTSGEDYATSVINNPWDMNDSADVMNLNKPEYQKQFKNASFADGAFTAESTIPADRSSQKESDAQVWMNINPDRPVDTWKYRYLSYTFSIDGSLYSNISDKVNRGWIVRSAWWSDAIETDGSVTNDNIVYEGIDSYSLDLHQANSIASGKPTILEPEDKYPAQSGWLGYSSVRNLRIDPIESSPGIDTRFYIYDVKLTALSEAVGNLYSVKYTLSDEDGTSLASLKIYASVDSNGANGTLLADLASPPLGVGSTEVSTTALTDGEYYVSLVVTDTDGNQSTTYSEAPLKVGQGKPRPPIPEPAQVDSDSDGLSNYLETNVHKTDPLKADTDGDRFSDSAEVNLLRSNPLVFTNGITSDLSDATIKKGRVIPRYAVTTNFGAKVFSAKGLPPGLKINVNNGVVSGKPIKSGVYRVKLTAVKVIKNKKISVTMFKIFKVE